MKKNNFVLHTVAAATLLMAQGSVQAQFSTSGYFRAGTISSGARTTQCYGLANSESGGGTFRLGNECDVFGEIDLSNKMKVGDLDVTAHLMPGYYSNATTDNSPNMAASPNWTTNQAYIEVSGADFAPEANFWVGKRYQGRADIHITDTKYFKLDGNGGGVDNLSVAGGKLGVGYYRRDASVTSSRQNGWGLATRINVDYNTSKVNEGGWLRVVGTMVQTEEYSKLQSGEWVKGTDGAALGVQHSQWNALGLGGANNLFIQVANGAAGLDGNFSSAFGGASPNSDGEIWTTTTGSWATGQAQQQSATRIADELSFQKGKWSGAVVANLEERKTWNSTVGKLTRTEYTAVGGRVAYAFTGNFKLLTEVGFSTAKPESGDVQTLNKITIAPTISTGGGLKDRPELRLFYSHFNWNDAAATAKGWSSSKKSADAIGVQAEYWW
nr:carbohydrate porin [uncultured Rhodoferax sp.]